MKTDLEYQRRIDHLRAEAEFYDKMSKFFGAAYVIFIAGLALAALVIEWANK